MHYKRWRLYQIIPFFSNKTEQSVYTLFHLLRKDMFHAWFYLLLLSSHEYMVSIMPFALLVNNESKMIGFVVNDSVKYESIINCA